MKAASAKAYFDDVSDGIASFVNYAGRDLRTIINSMTTSRLRYRRERQHIASSMR